MGVLKVGMEVVLLTSPDMHNMSVSRLIMEDTVICCMMELSCGTRDCRKHSIVEERYRGRGVVIVMIVVIVMLIVRSIFIIVNRCNKLLLRRKMCQRLTMTKA